MRLREIFESQDYHYATDNTQFDSTFNPEANYYANKERKQQEQLWAEANGAVPVVTKDISHPEKWTTDAPLNARQSPGFRGQQEAKQRADIPNKPYQEFNPNIVVTTTTEPEGSTNFGT